MATDDPSSRVGRLQETAKYRAADATAWATGLREKSAVADAAFLIYERDRVSAGTVLGSAIAFRLFLFFVPFVLFGVGLLGVFAGHIDAKTVTESASLTGALATEVRGALSQSTSAAYLAFFTGGFLMLTSGRSLANALVASSSLAWNVGGKLTAKVKAVAAIIGVVASLLLFSAIVNRVREELGLAGAGLSLSAGLFFYLALAMVLMSTLPRGTTDPGALLPGAALVSAVLVSMQSVSQLLLPDRLSDASDLYGGIGVAVVTLGWLFIFGRTMSLSFSVNAALFDRFGSLSQGIFALPILRIMPQRSQRISRYFGLDDSGRSIPAEHEAIDDTSVIMTDGELLTAIETLEAVEGGESRSSTRTSTDGTPHD